MKRSRFKGDFCDYVRAAKEDGVIEDLLNSIQCHLVEQGVYDVSSESISDSDLSGKVGMPVNVVKSERKAIRKILFLHYSSLADPYKDNYKLRREVD